PAEAAEGVGRAPVGLREDRDAEAVPLEDASEQGHRERRMVDVGVAGDEDDVDGVESARGHLGPRRRQELVGPWLATAAGHRLPRTRGQRVYGRRAAAASGAGGGMADQKG